MEDSREKTDRGDLGPLHGADQGALQSRHDPGGALLGLVSPGEVLETTREGDEGTRLNLDIPKPPHDKRETGGTEPAEPHQPLPPAASTPSQQG